MNSPEYTTSAPVIGPLIMCSGLVVSAKPYHARRRVASSSSSSRVSRSVDPSSESRLVSSRASSRRLVSRVILTHHHHHHHHHRLARQKSRSRLSRRLGRVSRVSRTASTNPQFATGPQKCVVFGPVGPLMKARIDMIGRAVVALCHRGASSSSTSSRASTPSRTARMETRGTGRASNGREIARWSANGDVAIGADRGCVVVEVRRERATRRMTRRARMSRMRADD